MMSRLTAQWQALTGGTPTTSDHALKSSDGSDVVCSSVDLTLAADKGTIIATHPFDFDGGSGVFNWPSRVATCERGSSILELTIIAAVFLLLLSSAIAGGRISIAGQSVEAAAFEAARAASLSRSASAASTHADEVARRFLTEQGLSCADISVKLDASGFGSQVGTSASVVARVSCRVSIRDLALPGLPGSRTMVGEASSPLDTFRARQP
jgi:Flp pilus assembly protein TadG